MKSLGATAIFPSMPYPASSLVGATAPVATPAAAAIPAFTPHHYQWAEMIVRAHNKCNIGLLQRSLRIDAKAASALKSSLIENGVVHAKANAYGIHKAAKPLYEKAFISTGNTVEKITNAVGDQFEKLIEDDEPAQENESEINNLDDQEESVSEQAASDTEVSPAFTDEKPQEA